MAADAIALNAGLVVAIATTGIALMLVLVSALSYARLRSTKMLFAGGAFLVLAAKGALWTYRGIALREMDLTGALMDFAVLAFLYVAVAKR